MEVVRKIIFLVVLSGLLFKCNVKQKNKNAVNIVIYDTVEVTKEVVDTVIIGLRNRPEDQVSEYYFQERLPNWIVRSEVLNGTILKGDYELDSRMNPLYFESDFNGDGLIDIAVPIKQFESNKLGFAIIHQGTNDTFIIGAGTKVKNGLIDFDDLSYIDIWKINRKRINSGNIDDEEGIEEQKSIEVIIENNSINISKSESGGGLIYWNGVEYEYLHQGC